MTITKETNRVSFLIIGSILLLSSNSHAGLQEDIVASSNTYCKAFHEKIFLSDSSAYGNQMETEKRVYMNLCEEVDGQFMPKAFDNLDPEGSLIVFSSIYDSWSQLYQIYLSTGRASDKMRAQAIQATIMTGLEEKRIAFYTDVKAGKGFVYEFYSSKNLSSDEITKKYESAILSGKNRNVEIRADGHATLEKKDKKRSTASKTK